MSFAQKDSTGNFILKGTVVNGINNELLKGAHIIINNTKGVKTDDNGDFTISPKVNDTIRVSYVGFKSLEYITPYKTKGEYLTKFKLYKDSLSLNEIEIFPWPSYKEFKKAFLAMDKQNEKIKMEGVNLYQDRNVTPTEFKMVHLFTNPISFIYDKLFDKKAKLNRRLDRRRTTIKNSAIISE